MNNKQKFSTFLESLKGNTQDNLIESIKYGFKICFEAEETSPIVGINNFVLRQTNSDFIGTAITKEQLKQIAQETTEKVISNDLKPGYASFVKIAVLNHPEILSPIVKIDEQNKDKLVTEMTKRREGEDEYEHSYFPASSGIRKTPSNHVKVILYTREQLEKEEDGNPVGSQFDIISINAEPYNTDTPIEPTTLKRNAGGKGGSGHQHSDLELSEAEKFWQSHAKVQ